MKTKEIQFDGKKYICRIVESIDGGDFGAKAPRKPMIISE